MRNMRNTVLAALMTLVMTGGLAGTAAAAAAVTEISGAGATFPYPVYAKWAEAYNKQTGVKMNYQSIGSGGGKIFAASPDENFSHKVNRKMMRAGMASILSQLAREDRIRVVEEFKVEAPKTKLLAQKVKAMGFDEVLVITDEVDQNLELSSRNLPNVAVLAVRQANPVALVRFPHVLLTRSALARLEEMYK